MQTRKQLPPQETNFLEVQQWFAAAVMRGSTTPSSRSPNRPTVSIIDHSLILWVGAGTVSSSGGAFHKEWDGMSRNGRHGAPGGEWDGDGGVDVRVAGDRHMGRGDRSKRSAAGGDAVQTRHAAPHGRIASACPAFEGAGTDPDRRGHVKVAVAGCPRVPPLGG